jgi:hypothetical protein
VADTGHHRVLVWTTAPVRDDAPADAVIGQSNFTGDARNAGGRIGATTLNMPTGIAFGAGVLAVADAWNHRVLLWHGIPRHAGQPADVVLGQPDFVSGEANRGQRVSRADTLNWCYGVAISEGRLLIADTGNRRVLVWNEIPTAHGAPADLVLGQRDFATHDETSGGDVQAGMRWPHATVVVGQTCLVADAGSSRVMVWKRFPQCNGTACDFVLGQSGFTDGDHNRGAYAPTAATLNMPYGMTQRAGQIIVADTANSRLLGFDHTALGMGTAATSLAGQRDFAQRGDNRWQAATRDSLCWPYCVTAGAATLAIADSGNNRVLVWDVS